MSIVYLNGAFMAQKDARISPMDRGFLFGDGIYEMIPSYGGKPIGLLRHLRRLLSGLDAIGIKSSLAQEDWSALVHSLIERNGCGNLGIYIQVSRGADDRRAHAFPDNILPTVFATSMPIPEQIVADKYKAKGLRVRTELDLRWRRCHIKSTSLLGNVLHFQNAKQSDCDETLLYNQNNQLTEASTSNVFIVKNGKVVTPPLDNQILPGITRGLIIDILSTYSDLSITERPVDLSEAKCADEVWLSSSTKSIAPVVSLDDRPIGDGLVGNVWQKAMQCFSEYQFDF